MPCRSDNIIDLFPTEPWSFQDLRVPVVTGEALRVMLVTISVMIAEMSVVYAAQSPEDVCGWLDQLQEMIRRPELFARFLDEAGLAALAGYHPALVDPLFWASTPPPQAA